MQQSSWREKEKARRKKCDVRFSLCQNDRADWGEEVAENLLGPCVSVERSNSGHHTNRKPEVEEADGSSSRPERASLALQ